MRNEVFYIFLMFFPYKLFQKSQFESQITDCKHFHYFLEVSYKIFSGVSNVLLVGQSLFCSKSVFNSTTHCVKSVKIRTRKTPYLGIFHAVAVQKITFSVKGFFSKCKPIRRKIQIHSHLLNGKLYCFCNLLYVGQSRIVYSFKFQQAFIGSVHTNLLNCFTQTPYIFHFRFFGQTVLNFYLIIAGAPYFLLINPVDIQVFKVNNGNTSTPCEICSKLTV